jgi:hypothetical protein
VATGKGSSYRPLSVRDKLKLQKAIKALRSPFHSVRVAAHREIQKILHRQRGARVRSAAVAKAAVRKVTPKRMHKTLGVRAEPAKAPKRQAPGPATPWRGYTPLTDRPLAKADLRQRDRDQRAERREKGQKPRKERTGRPSLRQRLSARTRPGQEDHPMPRGRDPRPDGAQKDVTRSEPGKAATNGHAPEERSAPAPARTAHPLPHETIRQPTRARSR